MALFKNKLLTAVSAQTPADEVARVALTERLLAVSYYLKHTIGGADEAEAVHQLRVWSRRAATAIEMFEAGLPRGHRGRMLKMLEKLRHAAGRLRDCDLLRQRVKGLDEDAPKSAVKELKRKHRQASQRFKKVREQYREGDLFLRRVSALLINVAWSKKASNRQPPKFGSLCRQKLTSLAREFFASASADLNQFDHLHHVRIAGKEWRYALELAAPLMAEKKLAHLHDALSDLQDRLGAVCDERALLKAAEKWLKLAKKRKASQRCNDLLAAQQHRYRMAHRKLLRWWSRDQVQHLRLLWQSAVR